MQKKSRDLSTWCALNRGSQRVLHLNLVPLCPGSTRTVQRKEGPGGFSAQSKENAPPLFWSLERLWSMDEVRGTLVAKGHWKKSPQPRQEGQFSAKAPILFQAPVTSCFQCPHAAASPIFPVSEGLALSTTSQSPVTIPQTSQHAAHIHLCHRGHRTSQELVFKNKKQVRPRAPTWPREWKKLQEGGAVSLKGLLRCGG